MGWCGFLLRASCRRRMAGDHRGFSLVEALICVALLGMLAAVSSAFRPAMQGAALLESELESLQLARAKMEELRAGPALALASSDTFDIRGEAVVRTWSASTVDLDGDGNLDGDAFRLRVEMGSVRLETIRTEPVGFDAIKR